jgi:hypothetical protein
LQKSNSRKSQPPPKKKDFGSKSPYFRKKDIRREDTSESLQKHHETESRQEPKESQKFYQSKPQKLENITKPVLEDNINKEENNIVSVDESNESKNTEAKDKDNDDTNLYVNDVKGNEVHLNQENKHILQHSDLLVSNIETEIVTYEAKEQLENKTKESQIVQMATAPASEIIKIDSIILSAKNTENNDENEIKSAENSLYDVSNDNNDVIEDKKQDPPMEETEIIVNNNCDNKQTKNIEQSSNIKYKRDSPEEKDAEKIVILSSTVISSVAKENNELNSNDSSLKGKNGSFTKMQSATADEQINIGDQQDAMKSANKIQECNNDNKKENSAENGIVVDKIEFPKENI